MIIGYRAVMKLQHFLDTTETQRVDVLMEQDMKGLVDLRPALHNPLQRNPI